jgi:hypothetical protein
MQMDILGRGTLGSLNSALESQEHNLEEICGQCNALYSPRETLVSLRIIVLQANLQLDGLHKISPLFASRFGEQVFDGAPHA